MAQPAGGRKEMMMVYQWIALRFRPGHQPISNPNVTPAKAGAHPETVV
jgi:hypothetical protein